MLFNSADFLIFFPITVLVYYLVPQRFRYLWLLAASYYFYMSWKPAYALLLIVSTLVTYAGGILVERTDNYNTKKLWLTLCMLIDLGILVYFKYTNMIIGYVNSVAEFFGISRNISWDDSIILPVGISFFTLQSLGYLIDVYRGDIYAEHNPLKYALFISFFPQLVAGPIERSKNLLRQLASPRKFNYDNLRHGLLLMIYGFFLKVLIADRIAIFVDTVYEDPVAFGGCYIVIATILFAVQIYCDFYGYSTIAKGAALTMGLHLMENFNAPYLSKSIKEFWRRWHISLSTWFRDYLYIPLGGSRRGKLRKYINLLIVFAVSGLWHGASASFAVWGLLHGAYLVIEDRIKPVEQKRFSSKIIRIVLTFFMTCFAWLFFRANSLSNAMIMLKQVLAQNNWFSIIDQSIFDAGVSKEYAVVLLIAIVIVLFVDYHKYHGCDTVKLFFEQGWWLRCGIEMFMLFMIILYGCYGSIYDVKQFIYFQF